MTRIIPLLLFGCFLTFGYGQLSVELETFTTGINVPTALAHSGDENIYVTEKAGRIRIVRRDGQLVNTPYIDISNRVRSGGGEQGLLGLAFHPEYADNGYFFVNYTRAGDGATVVSRFSRDDQDPDMGDPNSEKILLVIPQPFGNHNGGDLHFGPDGYLYISSGDGGSGGDPMDLGQDGESLLGKLLRIDVDSGDPYAIPENNPFVDDPDAFDEIWALGLRNPWRISFDRLTGDLWIGDVGQNAWEEIDFQPADSPGGENYGWRCYEGNEIFNPLGCDDRSAYVFPVHVYPNNRFNEGCSVTGGYVYRGMEYPVLYGKYLYGDFCTGLFWVLYKDDMGDYVNEEVGNFQGGQFGAFGEDVNGNLYAAALTNGIIYRIVVPCVLTYELSATDQSCPDIADGTASVEVTQQTGQVEYAWSNGATSASIDSLEPGVYYVTVSDGSCSFEDSVVVEASDLMICSLGAQSELICYGDEIELDGCPIPAGYTGQWMIDGNIIPGETGESIQASEAGRYTFAVEGDCHLEADGYIDLEVVQLDTPEIRFDTFTVTGPAGFSEYIWWLNGIELQRSSDSMFYHENRDGWYRLVVIDENGCVSPPDSIFLIFSGINRSVTHPLEFYPNPVESTIYIQIPGVVAKGTLQIFDTKGRVIKHVKLSPTSRLLAMEISDLKPGTYFIRLVDGQSQFSGKFVKTE
jgi:glucose/arabinose dehydrogenase